MKKEDFLSKMIALNIASADILENYSSLDINYTQNFSTIYDNHVDYDNAKGDLVKLFKKITKNTNLNKEIGTVASQICFNFLLFFRRNFSYF